MVDQKTIQAYAENIARYRDMVRAHGAHPRLAGFMARLAPSSHVLDLGCGLGDSAAAMRDAGLRVTCMDASPAMIEAAREMHGIDVIQRGFERLDDVDLYDGVWASFSLLHAPRADMPSNLANIARALRAGGIVYLGLKAGAGESRDDTGRFYAYYTADEITSLLDGAGFEMIDLECNMMSGMSGRTEPCLHATAGVKRARR